MSVRISISPGNDLADALALYPRAVKTAARLAINDTARFARRIATDQMTKEVNFPKGYLSEPGRFEVASFAQGDSLEAIVRARGRATSLRRFAQGDPTPESTRGKGAGGVTVAVKPGSSIKMPGAFIVRLKRGPGPIGSDSFNLGLAVRLKPGQVLKSKYKYNAVELGRKSGVYILYGPSVAQAFDIVRHEIISEVTSELDRQFRRQFLLQVGK